MFGYLGPNRRLDQLLRVLSEFAGQQQFHLDIYGEVSKEFVLRKNIRDLDLSKQVTIHGFVEESELEEALSAAHLAINLRNPSAGEASSSQLRIWSHALPSLVSRLDWYATIPENTVRFVRPEQELSDLRAHLQSFFANPASFAELGRNGLAFYRQQHLPEQYVDKLLKLVSDAKGFRAASAWQKLVFKARLETANSFAGKLSNREWSELIRWSRLPDGPEEVDEAGRRRINRKASLVYGRAARVIERSFFKRVKRFIRLHLPPRWYELYLALRLRIVGF